MINSLGLEYLYENDNEYEMKEKIINELRYMKYPHLKRDFDIHSNFEFCSELKQFYVIITRPRTFLLFYEEKANEHFSFFIRMINNKIFKYIRDNFFIDIIVDFYKSRDMLIDNKTQMKIRGDKTFEEGKYYEAAYFYSKAGEKLLEKHAKIYYNYNILKDEKKTNKNKLSDEDIRSLSYEVLNFIRDLKRHPGIFDDIYNIEAFCFVNIGDYKKAIDIYENKLLFYEVGEIYFNFIEDFEKAFIYYSKTCNYFKAIESLNKSDKKDRKKKLFEFINKKEIYNQMGLSEYFNYYKENINELFILESEPKRKIKDIFKSDENDDNKKDNTDENNNGEGDNKKEGENLANKIE